MSAEMWTGRKPKWPWRDYLTAEEAETIATVDAARAEIERLQGQRVLIQNRAIQRAKFAATRRALAAQAEAGGHHG